MRNDQPDRSGPGRARAQTLPQPGRWRSSASMIGQMLGIDEILLQTALLMGLVVAHGSPLGRGGFRPATSPTSFTLNASLMGFLRDQQGLIPVAVIAGLAADGLLHQLESPSLTWVCGPEAVRGWCAPDLVWRVFSGPAPHLRGPGGPCTCGRGPSSSRASSAGWSAISWSRHERRRRREGW